MSEEDRALFEGATAPEPKATPEVTPAAEPTAPAAPTATTPTSESQAGEPAIPSWRLREEAEGRRQAEARAQALEQRLNEIAAHLQQNRKAPDFYEDPDRAVQEMILRTVQPYAEETRRTLIAVGRMVASQAHGADKVDEAERAFLSAMEEQSLDPADYERVVQSPNRYDACVQWHKRQQTYAAVGDDPNTWFEKQLEAKLADPQFQAKLLEKVRGGAAARPSAVSFPPSLSRATGVAPISVGDSGGMSDSDLFAYARSK